VWLKIRSLFSNLFRAYAAHTTLRHRVLWPLWHLINVFLLRDSDDNHKYYQEFCARVETLETYGGIGAVRVTPTFLAAKLKYLDLEKVIQDANNPTDAERLIAINSLTVKSCYGGEKHRNPVGFYSRNSTESTLQHKHNYHKHHHHGGAVCPSLGMGSMDPPDRTLVTSSEGVGRGGGVSVLIKSINF